MLSDLIHDCAPAGLKADRIMKSAVIEQSIWPVEKEDW